tara:strand:+ start:168 stop:620 length:453 start_codon:yes stop_codon:yes gene_type:complete
MPTVIKATYENFVNVNTRKSLKLIFEVPEHDRQAALDMLGMPDVANSKWVAIAVLEPETHNVADPDTLRPAEKTPGERARIKAVMLCKDDDFQKWINRNHFETPRTEVGARMWICSVCGIESRSEIATNPEALKAFEAIETDFKYRDTVK